MVWTLSRIGRLGCEQMAVDGIANQRRVVAHRPHVGTHLFGDGNVAVGAGHGLLERGIRAVAVHDHPAARSAGHWNARVVVDEPQVEGSR